DVLIGNYHDVSRGVREGVDDEEAVLATVEHEVALVVLAIDIARRGAVTEDAGGSTVGRGDVGVAPWCKNVIHTGEGNKGPCNFGKQRWLSRTERAEVGRNTPALGRLRRW